MNALAGHSQFEVSRSLIDRRERRRVSLAGYAARGDGATAEILLLDLSYDGCGIQIPVELRPGETIKLSVGAGVQFLRRFVGAQATKQGSFSSTTRLLRKHTSRENVIASQLKQRSQRGGSAEQSIEFVFAICLATAAKLNWWNGPRSVSTCSSSSQALRRSRRRYAG